MAKGLTPVEPLLKEIDALKSMDEAGGADWEAAADWRECVLRLWRAAGLKDASKQIAAVDQGGLGLPEKDYYLRTGAKDVTLREAVCRTRGEDAGDGGDSAEQAAKDAKNIMAFETELAKASMGVTERRQPENDLSSAAYRDL